MEIKLTDIPIHTEQESSMVTIEMEEQMLSLDFRKDGALGAYLEFRVDGDSLSITVESAASDSEPQTIKVDLSGSGRKEQGR